MKLRTSGFSNLWRLFLSASLGRAPWSRLSRGIQVGRDTRDLPKTLEFRTGKGCTARVRKRALSREREDRVLGPISGRFVIDRLCSLQKSCWDGSSGPLDRSKGGSRPTSVHCPKFRGVNPAVRRHRRPMPIGMLHATPNLPMIVARSGKGHRRSASQV